MTPIVFTRNDRTPTGEWVLHHPAFQDLTRGSRITLQVTGMADPVDAVVVGRTLDGYPTATQFVAGARPPTPPNRAPATPFDWSTDPDHSDPLRPAIGIGVGVLAGSVMWAAAAALVWWWTR